jgi:hypothetical protein
MKRREINLKNDVARLESSDEETKEEPRKSIPIP